MVVGYHHFWKHPTTHISETEPKKHGETMFFFTSSPFRQVEVELYRDFLSLVQ